MIQFKAILFYILFLFAAINHSIGQVRAPKTAAPDVSAAFKNLQARFVNIPDSVQTSVYWYWISDNISKEGVIKDLEAQTV